MLSYRYPNIIKNDLTFPSLQTWTSALLTRVLTESLVSILRMHLVVSVILAGWDQDVKMVTIYFLSFDVLFCI